MSYTSSRRANRSASRARRQSFLDIGGMVAMGLELSGMFGVVALAALAKGGAEIPDALAYGAVGLMAVGAVGLALFIGLHCALSRDF